MFKSHIRPRIFSVSGLPGGMLLSSQLIFSCSVIEFNLHYNYLSMLSPWLCGTNEKLPSTICSPPIKTYKDFANCETTVPPSRKYLVKWYWITLFSIGGTGHGNHSNHLMTDWCDIVDQCDIVEPYESKHIPITLANHSLMESLFNISQ